MGEVTIDVPLPLLGSGYTRDLSEEIFAFIKFYNPNGPERWYVCAHNPLLPMYPCLGLQILEDGKRTLGFFFLEELRLFGGLDESKQIKRDYSFKPTQLRNCP